MHLAITDEFPETERRSRRRELRLEITVLPCDRANEGVSIARSCSVLWKVAMCMYDRMLMFLLLLPLIVLLADLMSSVTRAFISMGM